MLCSWQRLAMLALCWAIKTAWRSNDVAIANGILNMTYLAVNIPGLRPPRTQWKHCCIVDRYSNGWLLETLKVKCYATTGCVSCVKFWSDRTSIMYSKSMDTNFYSKPSIIECSKMKLLLFQGVAECVSLLKILQNHFYCCFYPKYNCPGNIERCI
jgi:hypothetical protein